MPDILVLSALVPKTLGAKVILDLHDPMPELMMTIFNVGQDSVWVRTLKRLEEWSIRRTDLALTVNPRLQEAVRIAELPPGGGRRPAGSKGRCPRNSSASIDASRCTGCGESS